MFGQETSITLCEVLYIQFQMIELSRSHNLWRSNILHSYNELKYGLGKITSKINTKKGVSIKKDLWQT